MSTDPERPLKDIEQQRDVYALELELASLLRKLQEGGRPGEESERLRQRVSVLSKRIFALLSEDRLDRVA